MIPQPPLPERSTPKPRPVNQRSESSGSTAAPAKASSFARSRRPRRCQERSGSRTSSTPASTVPPADLGDHRPRPGSRPRHRSPGSEPRSKRWLASVCMPSRLAVMRTRRRSKWALSIRRSRVASVTSLSRPAHHPAQGHGPLGVGDHQRSRDREPASWPSRVLSFVSRPEPVAPRSQDLRAWRRSKAWSGWPSSQRTKLVTSTTLLMGRWPIDSRRRRSHSGLGPIVTPRTTRAAYRGQPSRSSITTFAASVVRSRALPQAEDRRPAQGDVSEHRDLPRQAEVVHAVRPVGGDVDVEQCVVMSAPLPSTPSTARPAAVRRRGQLLGIGRQVHVLGEPLAGEFHQPLTCRSSRSSLSKSSRMLGMP